MNNYKFLFSCASWEDRFILGLEHIKKNEFIEKIQIFEISEFREQTNIKKLASRVAETSSFFDTTMSLSMIDDRKSWKTLEAFFENLDLSKEKVLLDISTMPRFLIWFLLHFLKRTNCEIHYRYFSPEYYGDCDWLSGEPKEPRLIFKHSGLHLPDKNTLLILQTGFDTERVSQLLNSYEPSLALLALQNGDQHDNFEKNIQRHKEQLSFQDLDTFEIDAFNADHGYKSIEEKINTYKETHNIIMASFGPKPTSIAMFKLNLAIPEAALVYVPAISYNPNYSTGIRLDNIQSGIV